MKYSKRKFTFDEGTAVDPEGDTSLDVFSDWTVLSLPTFKKKLMTERLKIYIANMLTGLEKLQWNLLTSDMNLITLSNNWQEEMPQAVPEKAQAGHQEESFHWKSG